MRAVCEACERPQPIDWKPGDLCVHCGKAARREVRCFWCVKWTPEAKFCRSCGAAVADPRDFGAARMLKDAGTDRFTIPKLLVELDPEQIENFRRVYQRHSIAVERYAMEIRRLEQKLDRKDWAAKFEDAMTARLPLAEQELAALESPAARPVALVNDLSLLVQFLDGEASVRQARGLLAHGDADLAFEAAMTFSHWRVLARLGILDDRRTILDKLRQRETRPAIAVRIAQLGGESSPAVRDALASRDPDLAFQAALALGDVDLLAGRSNDPDPLVRFAAGDRLADLGAAGPLVRILPSLDPEYQERILRTLHHRRKPVPLLRPTLFEIAEATNEPNVRAWACLVLCHGCPPVDTLRIAKAGQGDSHVYQALLQAANLPPENLEALGAFLIGKGHFHMHQYGMMDIAAPGRMAAGFVPRHFEQASDEARVELIRFAEEQLGHEENEDLHRFLIRLKFDARWSREVHSAVWSSLHRWYYRIEVGNMGPMILGQPAAERFFGSFPEFLGALSGFLSRHDSLADLFVRDPLTRFLRYRDDGFESAVAEQRSECERLCKALLSVCENGSLDSSLRQECLALLGKLPGTAKLVERLLGTDLDFTARLALGLASY